MPDTPASSRSPLEKVLGRLIRLFRESPGRDDLVRETMRRVEGKTIQHAAILEAGIENTWGLDGDPLKERLLLRQVDAIRVQPGATPDELLALARALAAEEGPIPSSPHIEVDLVRPVIPGSVASQPAPAVPAPPAIPRMPGAASLPPRLESEDPSQVAGRILAELPRQIERQEWYRVLTDLVAATRLLERIPDQTRRQHTIVIKRLLTPAVIEALIEQAYRLTEEQARTAEVLRSGGLQAAEQVLEILKRGGTVGPRAFLLDAVASAPELIPTYAVMVGSPNHFEAWLGAELLGRIASPEVVPVLTPLVRHPEVRVRRAAIEALGRLNEKGVVEALRSGLQHEAAATRILAGQALASRGSRAIAMPLVAALEAERDPTAWDALLEAIAGMEFAEGPAALARMVLESKGRGGFSGGANRRHLAIVRALAASPAGAARRALETIAAGGTGEPQELARRLLGGG